MSAGKKVSNKGRKMQIWGWIIACMFSSVFIAGLLGDDIFDEVMEFVIAAMLAAWGIFLIIRGRKVSRIATMFKKYVSILSNSPDRSLSYLAASCGQQVEETTKNLEYMIKSNYFANAYIDYATQSLVLHNNAAVPEAVGAQHNSNVPSSRVVTCGGCGATNRITGPAAQCEYCGAQIL